MAYSIDPIKPGPLTPGLNRGSNDPSLAKIERMKASIRKGNEAEKQRRDELKNYARPYSGSRLSEKSACRYVK